MAATVLFRPSVVNNVAILHVWRGVEPFADKFPHFFFMLVRDAFSLGIVVGEFAYQMRDVSVRNFVSHVDERNGLVAVKIIPR